MSQERVASNSSIAAALKWQVQKEGKRMCELGAAPVISAYLPIAGNGTYSRFHRVRACWRPHIYDFFIAIYTACLRITACSFNYISLSDFPWSRYRRITLLHCIPLNERVSNFAKARLR